ncbi:BQ2448_3563 [Microbotryum intermedium]|uniref:BQ2448_3563 protein n=1 Tax=Microbotryum intermedium TaxID=269621 RepID=A0A238FFA5_9BASI|nr:BQ2448_3563 [Microbotryum intermedium]
MSWRGGRNTEQHFHHSSREPNASVGVSSVWHPDTEVADGFDRAANVVSEPIAIVPSSTSHHAPLQEMHTVFESVLSLETPPNHIIASSSSSSSLLELYGREGSIVDGPLRDLRPPFAVLSSSRSSGGTDEFALSPTSPPGVRRLSPSFSPSSLTSGASPFARRVVSAPQVVVGSPRSPLADETHSFHVAGPGTRRKSSAQYPPPRPAATNVNASSASLTSSLYPSPQSSRRRRASASAHSISLGTSSAMSWSMPPAVVPHGSFVGSFEQSVVTGRLSALPSLPLPFLASIGVLGGTDAPSRLRCPPHLNIPFEAFFYSGPEGAKGSSPYVGTIDLEAYYCSLLHADKSQGDEPVLAAADGPIPSKPSLPRFPGYRVPVRGQVQLIVKNPNSTAIKLFLILYDLSGLDRQRQGGKTFVRQKSYAFEASDASTKGRLRYAIHLQFCSPAMVSSSASGNKVQDPHYYLHGNVRIVFASRALDLSEKLRVVAEGPHGEGDLTSLDFAPYAGPGAEWEMARTKAKQREKRRSAAVARPRTASDPTGLKPDTTNLGIPVDADVHASMDLVQDHDGIYGPPALMPPIVDDPDGVAFDLAQSSTETPPTELAFFAPRAVAVSPPRASSFWSNNVTTSSRGPLAKSNLSISFVRAASPAPGAEIGRPPSGLSSSRPASRNAHWERGDI